MKKIIIAFLLITMVSVGFVGAENKTTKPSNKPSVRYTKKLKSIPLTISKAKLPIVKGIDYPSKADFSLTVSVSKKIFKVGETLEVKALLKNLKSSKIKLDYGTNFSDEDVIMINTFGEENPKHAILSFGFLRTMEFKAKQKIAVSRKFKMKKKGKYDVVASVVLNCYNAKGHRSKEDIHISKLIKVEVR